MKKIIILILIILAVVFIFTREVIEYAPDLNKAHLYKYFTDETLRQQYQEYQSCKEFADEKSCLDEAICIWEITWFDGHQEEYCKNKKHKDYIRIQNLKKEFMNEQDELSENFKESII